jgi:hypothetical protein
MSKGITEPADASDAPSPPGDDDLSPLLDQVEIEAQAGAERPDPNLIFRPRCHCLNVAATQPWNGWATGFVIVFKSASRGPGRSAGDQLDLSANQTTKPLEDGSARPQRPITPSYENRGQRWYDSEDLKRVRLPTRRFKNRA